MFIKYRHPIRHRDFLRVVAAKLTLFLLLFKILVPSAQAQTCTELNGSYVYSGSTYLGFFGSASAVNSIMNSLGPYGSTTGTYSVRNTFGLYGSSYSTTSANNNFASNPPVIYKHGVALYYLTTNSFKTPRVSLASIDAACVFTSFSPITYPAYAPAAVSAADGTNTSVLAVGWTAVAGATSYNVYISTTNSNYASLGNTSNLGTTITGLAQGVTYYIAVTAVNSGGESLTYNYDTGYLATPTSFTVTPSSGANGSIDPSTAVIVAENDTTSFTVTADSGYEISSIGGTCGGILSGSTYTTNAITADCTVSASFSQITHTVTPSAGSGGSISPSTPQNVVENNTASFTVTADSGYEISSIGGTCGGILSGSTYTTNAITADCTVSASFSQITHTVTPSAGSGGSISPSTPQNVVENNTASFTVTADSGYEISSVGGTCGGTLSGSTYTTNAITADCTVSASFSQITHTVTPSAGSGGSISPSTPQNVVENNTASFTVTADSGYEISSVDGTCGGTLSGSTYTTNAITGDCSVDATFTEIAGVVYRVTPSAGANGSIDPSTAVIVAENATTSFRMSADSGYEISSVGGTCGGKLWKSTYTTNAITADCTVSASFSQITHTVTPSAGSGGSISPSTPQNVVENNTASFTVTADSGYEISSVGGTCGGTLSDSTYTTNAITADCTVSASFSQITHTVTPSAGSGGSISPSTPQNVVENNTASFTVTADSGYEISSIGGTCGGTLSGSTYTTNAITGDCSVDATFTEIVGVSYTVTPSAGANGSIGPSTAVIVAENDTTSFTVTADSGYEISSIGGTCGGTLSGSTYTTNAITGDCSVDATFTEIVGVSYTVTPSAGANGSIGPSTAVIVAENDTTSFTVTADSGYEISSIGGTCGGTLSGSTYTTNAITGDCSVDATFTEIVGVSYTVTPSAGANGSIGPSTAVIVAENDTTSFTVTADSGYEISSIGGTCGGTLSGSTYTTNAITGDCSVDATFTEIVGVSYTVTPSAGANGSIDPSTAVIVAENATTSFTVTADSGYEISSVGGTCGGTLSGSTYTTNAITADCTVSASFSQITHTVTPSAGSGGSISPSTPQNVVENNTASFTVTADSGYEISSIGGMCGGELSGSIYTTNAIISDCTVTATFSERPVSPAEAFIERFYVNILGRPSDAGGLNAWLDVINNQSASAVVLGFLNSPEFLAKNLDDAAFVDILYRTLFDREGDAGGVDYWLSELASGKLRDMVIWGFLRAAEFKTLSDSFGVTALNAADESAYGIRAFVERFYTLVLGRQPDRGGFDNWVTALTNGSYAGGDIAKAFFLSPEYLSQNTTDEAFVETVYRAFFGREADPAGKEGWLNVLAQGQSREYVLNGFIGSAEFAALAASYGINASRVAGVLDRPEDGIAAERRTQKAGDAEAIPALPMLALFIFSGLLGLFGVRRLASAQ